MVRKQINNQKCLQKVIVNSINCKNLNQLIWFLDFTMDYALLQFKIERIMKLNQPFGNLYNYYYDYLLIITIEKQIFQNHEGVTSQNSYNTNNGLYYITEIEFIQRWNQNLWWKNLNRLMVLLLFPWYSWK